MTNDQIWNKINIWKKKYDDYANDYWVLSNARNSLAESVNGLDTLYNAHYKFIKELVEIALGDQDILKNNLQLTKNNIDSTAKDTHDDIQLAMNLLTEAMDNAQNKINYYYNQLD